MRRGIAVPLALLLGLARSSSATDVDTAPYLFSFGVRSPNPPGGLTMTIESGVHYATGSVYVVESTRVQKFDRDGGYLLGWTCSGCAGIGVNQTTGDVYVTVYDQHQVKQFNANGVFVRQWGTNGSGDGQLAFPHGVAVDSDSGEVFVFDTGNGRIEVFSGTGTYLRQFGHIGVGPGDFSGLPSPGGITVDEANDLVYVTDPRIHRLFKWTTAGVFVTKWGDPLGIDPGHFHWPRSVDVDGQGRVYVTDTDSERIQYFEADGTYLGQIQGPNNVIDGAFHPRDIAINRLTGEKYVNAAYAFREDKFDANNVFVRSWGGHNVDGSSIEAPQGIAISPTTGDVFLFDSSNMLMKRFSAGGAFIKQWGGSNRIDVAQPGLFGQGIQSGVGVGADGRLWTGMVSVYYATDPLIPWLVQFDPTGAVTNFQLRKPVLGNYEEQVRDVVVEPTTGDVFVADAAFNLIRRLTPSGAPVVQATVPEAAGLAFAGGKLYAVDPLLSVVRRYDANLNYEATIGGPGSGDGQLSFQYASDVAVDGLGRIFVTDSNHHRIQQFDPDGTFRAKRGTYGSGPGEFALPMDLEISPTGDLLYVADTFNHRVQVFCLGLPATCASLTDDDADGLRDAQDNCPFVANPDQADTGGVGSATPDGVGNACQCGDVTNDNRVTSADLDAIRAELATPGTLASTARCSVVGGTECNVADVVVLERVLASAKPRLDNVCAAAGHSGP
jgi:DNA-binding beta-propeller fold protein YncE